MINLEQLKQLILQKKQEMFYDEPHKEKVAREIEQARMDTQFWRSHMNI